MEPYVILGYIDKNKKSPQANVLKGNDIAKKFLSKIGGKPYWLNRKSTPKENEFHCRVCQNKMSFVLQLYAPILEKEHCFHRCLYIFVCLKCGDQAKCFRTQLPRENEFYFFTMEQEGYDFQSDIQDMNDKKNDKEFFIEEVEYKTCCKICGIPCEEGKNHELCEKDEHIIFEENLIYSTDEETYDSSESESESESGSINTSYNKTNYINKNEENSNERTTTEGEYMNGNIVDKDIKKLTNKHEFKMGNMNEKVSEMLNHNEKSETPLQGNESNRNKQVLTINDEMTKRNNNDEDEDKIDESEMQAFEDIQKEVEKQRRISRRFKKFIKILEKRPNQILRYSYGGKILHVTPTPFNSNKNNIFQQNEKNNSINEIDTIKCNGCNSETVFEFQVLSTIINFLKIKKNIVSNYDINLNLKFAFIAVYTCLKNCESKYVHSHVKNENLQPSIQSKYIQEYTYVQNED